MKKRLNTCELPEIGMGVTINGWSDKHAGTIIEVLRNGRSIVIQADTAIRIDNNGMSESQEYTYQPNPQGSITVATLRQDGSYRVKGGSSIVSLGFRREYYDYSF